MFRSAVLISACTAMMAAPYANAFGKKKPDPTSLPKTVVRLQPAQNMTIALPQAVNPLSPGTVAPSYDFGPNLVITLGEKMTNSHYILDEPRPLLIANDADLNQKVLTTSDAWDGSKVVPAAQFTFTTDALVFRSGDRGDSMFYGFDERVRTPFNDGTDKQPNEFPLSLVQFQHWFDRTFQDRGTSPFDMWSGLDLGEGFSFNALVAWVDVKYALYRSEIRMHVRMDAPLVGRHEEKVISVKGSGFFFDIVGGYEMWQGGIGLARTDAMGAAFKNAFAATYSVIDGWAKSLPLTALLYDVKSADKIYLNTGINSNIPVGTRYSAATNPDLVLEVIENVPSSGSIAKLVFGDIKQLQLGESFVEQKKVSKRPISQLAMGLVSGAEPLVATGTENIVLPSQNLPKSDFAGHGWNPSEDFWKAALDSLIGMPFLPYRIWRYFQHDLAYNGPNPARSDQSPIDQADQTPEQKQLDPEYGKINLPDVEAKDGEDTTAPQKQLSDWLAEVRQEPWAKQINLDVASFVTLDGPLVAVIDSGVDYNHWALRQRIWQNPAPMKDPNGEEDRFGWDFVSEDSRPYDDNYHGTEVASVLLAVAPTAHIMPLKVFNAYGVTSSAAIYGAFQYAVDHGAKIIVAGWATQKETQTLDLAVKYAHDHGVLVVTSAGDRGDNLSKNPEYPAVLSLKYDNVLTVTGVDADDKPVQVNGFYANTDQNSIAIAAPGKDILVAQPRGHVAHDTMTSLSAAMVAGAIARNWAMTVGAGTYQDWIAHLLAQADWVPSLGVSVHGGLRLRIR